MFKQKTFPEVILNSAKKLEADYFIDHVIQIDYFNKGYSAIPSLFSFCFDKKAYEQLFLKIDEIIFNITQKEDEFDNELTSLIADPNINPSEKNNMIQDIESSLEEIKKQKKIFQDLKLFRESDFNSDFDIDLKLTEIGISPFVYHNNSLNFSKPVNGFLVHFIDKENEATDDFVQIYSKRTVREFIQHMLSQGFKYDKENCIFGNLVEKIGLVEECISDEEVARLSTIETISNFVKGNDWVEYVNYIESNNIDSKTLFSEKSLEAYAIAMDKKYFAQKLISTNDKLTLTLDNKINDLVYQAVYSIIYRKHPVEDYLKLIISKIDFSNKDQDYINKFVNQTFVNEKKSLNREVFKLYKNKIETKKLLIALLKDCNVYRLENDDMFDFISENFVNYKEDILEIEGLLSHFNYYQKTMKFLNIVAQIPEIKIGDQQLYQVISILIEETENKLESIIESGETKYDFWEGDESLKTEQDYLSMKLDKLKEFYKNSKNSVSFEEEDDDLVKDELDHTYPFKDNKASDYVFSVYEGESNHLPLKGIVVYITDLNFWKNNGCMYDMPDYKPLNFMPREWMADDINECGTWFLLTDLDKTELKEKMIEIGFVYDESFNEFINSN